MSKRQRDETLSESLTRQIYWLVFWLLTLSVIVIETNWFLSLGTTGRNVVGAGVLLSVVVLGVVLALALRGARDGDEVKELLRTALENPGKVAYNLGGLKKQADDWMREALTEAGTEGGGVDYVGGELVE